MPCWDGVGAVSRRVLRTVTGWWQRTCAWRRGEAEVTACVRRGGGDLRGLKGGQRRNEKKRKEINITLLACPRMGQWRRRDLRGLRGEERGRGGGFENPACGEKRSLLQWSEKKRKKEEKNITLFVPANAGNGGDGCGG